MDGKDLELLEFHKVREILAGFTSFSVSRELALKLVPLSDEEDIRLRLRQSAEARRLLSLSPDIGISGVRDVRVAAEMAARGKTLDPQSLLEILETLNAAQRLKDHLLKLENELPLLADLARRIHSLEQLRKDIGSCLAPTGDVLDTASPKLASVRQRIRDVRQELLIHLQSIIDSPKGRKIIQEPVITEREARYVIPVKVEYRRQIKGIVHDVSDSGATLFIEPWTSTDLQNQLRQLIAEEKYEVERILRRLSAEVGAFEGEISGDIKVIAEIDLALAKARYAKEAEATEPVIVAFSGAARAEGHESAGGLRLVRARHPLLGKKAVPLSIEIGENFTVLVITGPNTGGKTVTLKTIGLLTLMALAGLPIPAEAESRIPIFDSVYADIGDEQSIEQTLSTFSWHIGNIVRIINNATAKSLVLLDELGTNTDPVEGSALASAVLLHFLSRRTITVATTHYSELKAMAHNTRGMENAALEVDPVTLAPTYRLRVGIPGGSNALATASRLGLSAEIIGRARDLLSRGNQQIEALLSDLAMERANAESLRRSLEKELGQARDLQIQLESRLRELEEERRTIINQTRDSLVREAAHLRAKIREAASALQKQRSQERLERAKKALADVQEKLSAGLWQESGVSGEETRKAEINSITVGDTVWVREAGLPATVLSVSKERGLVEVHSGKVKMTLKLASVEKIVPSVDMRTPTGVFVAKGLSSSKVSLELNLRGRRAEEVEPALDTYLNEAFLRGLRQVRIIHGVGTGTVRCIVREVLSSHPLVTSFRPGEPEEGGDGVTIVTM